MGTILPWICRYQGSRRLHPFPVKPEFGVDQTFLLGIDQVEEQYVEALQRPIFDFLMLRLAEVTDRLDAGDAFARTWKSFDPVRAGERIGTRADGTPLVAEEAGWIVFPNPDAPVGHSTRKSSP